MKTLDTYNMGVQQNKEEISQLKEAQKIASMIVTIDPYQSNTGATMENLWMQKEKELNTLQQQWDKETNELCTKKEMAEKHLQIKRQDKEWLSDKNKQLEEEVE